MAERLTLVCDRKARGGHACPNEAETYTVAMPDGTTWRADLCEQHAAPLLEVRDYGSRQKRQYAKPARKTFRKTEVAPKG